MPTIKTMPRRHTQAHLPHSPSNIPPDYVPIARPTWPHTLLNMAAHLVPILIGIWLIKWFDLPNAALGDWFNLQNHRLHLAAIACIILILFGTNNLSSALINHLITRYDQAHNRPTYGTKYLDPNSIFIHSLLFCLLGLTLSVIYLFALLSFNLSSIISSLPLLAVLLYCYTHLKHNSFWQIDYHTQSIHIYHLHHFGWQKSESRPLSDFCGITQDTNSAGETEIILLSHTGQANLPFHRTTQHNGIHESEKQLHHATGLPILRRTSHCRDHNPSF